MDLDFSLIKNNTIRKALEAFQKHDKEAFYSYFSDDLAFFNKVDGRTFKDFFDEVIEYNGILMDLEQVREEGKFIFSNMRMGKIGIFRTQLLFDVNAQEKISRFKIEQMGITLNESWTFETWLQNKKLPPKRNTTQID